MKARILNEQGEKTSILVFDKGDEVMSTLLQFITQNTLYAAHFTAIGAFSDMTVGYFQHEQVEVLSLLGDIALKEDGTPQIHAHVVVGDSNGMAHGGHDMEAHVWPTLELILEEAPAQLHKRSDPESGLALIDPSQS